MFISQETAFNKLQSSSRKWYLFRILESIFVCTTLFLIIYNFKSRCFFSDFRLSVGKIDRKTERQRGRKTERQKDRKLWPKGLMFKWLPLFLQSFCLTATSSLSRSLFLSVFLSCSFVPSIWIQSKCYLSILFSFCNKFSLTCLAAMMTNKNLFKLTKGNNWGGFCSFPYFKILST